MEKLLKQVNLRNEYRVYESNGMYLVKGENRRGQRYECKVPPPAVSHLCEKMKRRRITHGGTGRCSPEARVRTFQAPLHLRRQAEVLGPVRVDRRRGSGTSHGCQGGMDLHVLDRRAITMIRVRE